MSFASIRFTYRPAAATRSTLLALTIGALAACSGGGGPPSAPKPAATTPSAVPAGKKITGGVTIKLHSPRATSSSAKRRNYVSPSTTGVILSVDDTTASATTTYGYDVSPQSSSDTTTSCGATASDGTRTCQLYFPATTGDSITLSATIYDQVPSPVGASPTAAGHELASGTASATTIVGGQNNLIAITLEGLGARLQTEVLGVPDVGSFEKLPYVQFHVVDYDGNPIDAEDATDPFLSPITATISDGGDTSGCTHHCMAFNFNLTTLTTSITEPSNNNIDDEAPQLFLGAFGNTTNQTNGTGDENTTPPYYAELVATPNTGASATDPTQSGIAYIAPLFPYPASVSLTGSTPGAIYADQFMPPSGTAASPYTIDASKCSSLLTASAPGTAPYGAKFTLTGLTNGSCDVTIDDGVAVDATTAGISVSGFATSPVTLVQSTSATSTGTAVASETATLTTAPSAGNTIVVIVAQGASSTAGAAVATPAGFTQIANVATTTAPVVQGFAVFAKTVAAGDPKTVTVAWPATETGALAVEAGEYANTSVGLISSVTDTADQTADPSSTTPSVTPDSTNAFLITGASSAYYRSLTAADPYTVTAGYTETYAAGGTSATGTDAASLDVQTKALGSSVAAVSNTFTAAANEGTTAMPKSTDFILYLRAAH